MGNKSDTNPFNRQKALPPLGVTLQSASAPQQGSFEVIGPSICLLKGTGSLTKPIAVSSGCACFGTELFLSLDMGTEHGSLDLGWNLTAPAILRKTEKRLLRDLEEKHCGVLTLPGAGNHVFVISVQGKNTRNALLEQAINRPGYRADIFWPRIQTLLTHIERWRNHTDLTDVFWPLNFRGNVSRCYAKFPGFYAARLHHGARETVGG